MSFTRLPIKETDLSFTDVTTNNASTSAHGFVPKLPNDAAQFYDGTGAYQTLANVAGNQRCAVYNDAAQTVGTGAETVLTFNTEIFDNDGMHSTSANTGRITITTCGSYLLRYSTQVAIDAGNNAYTYIRKNGATAIEGSGDYVTGGVSDVVLKNGAVVTACATSYYEVLGFHNRGIDTNFGSATIQWSAAFTAVRMF